MASHRRDSHGWLTEIKKSKSDRFGNDSNSEYKRGIHRVQSRVNYHSRHNQSSKIDPDDLRVLRDHEERKKREREERHEEKRENAREYDRKKREAKLERDNEELERRIAEMRSRSRKESRAGVSSDGSSYYVNRYGVRTNY